jgi:hypothetical protein
MRGTARLLVMMMLASPLGAQGELARGYLFREPPVSISLRGGLASAVAGGDLWAFTFDELTLGRRDLSSIEQGGDIAIRLSPRLDLVIAYDVSDVSRRSEMRDWVDPDGFPIRQTTRFIRRPFGASVRYHLRDRGHSLGNYAWVPTRFVPFVGLGVGRMAYSLDQAGEFVNPESLEIFEDQYRASGRTAYAQASLGASWVLLPSLALRVESRYLFARADGNPSFVGFDRLDLSGLSTSLGLSLSVY